MIDTIQYKHNVAVINVLLCQQKSTALSRMFAFVSKQYLATLK